MKRRKPIIPTHNAITLWSIPADNPEPGTAAAVMEAIASETRKSVINVYFETCMQEKISRNEKTMEMMQLLLDTSYVNTEGLFSKMFGDSLLSFRSMLYAKNSNVASWYEKNKPVFEKEIAKTVEALQKIQ